MRAHVLEARPECRFHLTPPGHLGARTGRREVERLRRLRRDRPRHRLVSGRLLERKHLLGAAQRRHRIRHDRGDGLLIAELKAQIFATAHC